MSSSLIIRPIKKTDNEALATIIRTTFEEFDAPRTGTVYSDPSTDQLFELFEEQKAAQCFVAELMGEVVGSCGIYPTSGLPKGYAELVKFYLSPTARGKGIGKKLFEKSIDFSKEKAFDYLYIESQPSFSKAVKMYEKYGFQFIDHPLGNSGHDNCDLWMTKKL